MVVCCCSCFLFQPQSEHTAWGCACCVEQAAFCWAAQRQPATSTCTMQSSQAYRMRALLKHPASAHWRVTGLKKVPEQLVPKHLVEG